MIAAHSSDFWIGAIVGACLFATIGLWMPNPFKSRRAKPPEKWTPVPRLGDVKWSAFFGSPIMLVDWTRDDYYLFRIMEGTKRGLVLRNDTPWSALPHLPAGYQPPDRKGREPIYGERYPDHVPPIDEHSTDEMIAAIEAHRHTGAPLPPNVHEFGVLERPEAKR